MNRFQRKLMALIVTMMAISASADNGNRMLVCSSTYGDPLGQTSVNVCTAKRYHIYDVNGNTQAVINSKTNQGESEFVTVDYNSYKYGTLGLLESIDVFQYGAFDYLQRDIKASPAASSSYEYDANGNLIRENKAGVIYEYEYDADGNIVKETVSTGKTVIYEDFSAGKNKYAKAVSTHTSKNNEADQYDEYVTYDANGNKVSALRNYNTDTSYVIFGKEYGHHIDDFMSYEEWTYDADGIITLYQKAVQQDEVSGDYLWATKTEYERVDGNSDMIRRVNYDARYADGEPQWSRRGTPFVDEYCRFIGTDILEGLELTATPSSGTYGNVTLSITIPQSAIAAGVSGVNVYRNGELVAVLSDASESMTYEDTNVRNGSQEYFVTLTMPGTDFAEYVCSNKSTAVLDAPLPRAVILGIQDKSQGANGTMNVTIYYDYESDPTEAVFGYKETFLVVNGGGYPDDNANAVTNNPHQHTLKRDFESNTDVTLQIATRYALGTVLSEPLVFNPSTAQTGIEEHATSTSAVEYYDLQGRRTLAPTGIVLMKSNGTVKKVVK